jgi:hypothetical protein
VTEDWLPRGCECRSYWATVGWVWRIMEVSGHHLVQHRRVYRVEAAFKAVCLPSWSVLKVIYQTNVQRVSWFPCLWSNWAHLNYLNIWLR